MTGGAAGGGGRQPEGLVAAGALRGSADSWCSKARAPAACCRARGSLSVRLCALPTPMPLLFLASAAAWWELDPVEEGQLELHRFPAKRCLGLGKEVKGESCKRWRSREWLIMGGDDRSSVNQPSGTRADDGNGGHKIRDSRRVEARLCPWIDRGGGWGGWGSMGERNPLEVLCCRRIWSARGLCSISFVLARGRRMGMEERESD
ncbi:unnamed protein product [Urochloa humidicola]